MHQREQEPLQSLRQRPYFRLDHDARRQLRETRETVLAALRADPENFKALVIADLLCEVDPERDADLIRHGNRFRATRAADWALRAKELGLDRLLFHLANGWRQHASGHVLTPVLERRAAEISEARAVGVEPGLIDASYIPSELAADRRAQLAYHPSGHLARAAIHVDKLHEGELVLAEQPGSGHLRILRKRGGYGTMINETYRDGGVETVLNTPWHDGEVSIDTKPWTRWVEENLAELSQLVRLVRMRRRKRVPVD